MLIQRSSIAPSDLAQFYQYLAKLVQAGVPASECFDILAQDIENPNLAQAITAMQRSAKAGLSLSDCLTKSPLNTSEIANRLLRDAQIPIDQHSVLMALADEQEHIALVASVKRKIWFWPLIYFLFAGLFMMLLLIFVLPAFQSVYDGFDIALPLPTRLLLLLGPGALLLGVILILLWFGVSRTRHLFSQVIKDKITFLLPVLGGMRKKIFLHQYLRTFSLLLLRKIPTDEAMRLAADSVDTQYFSNVLQQAQQSGKRELLDQVRAVPFMPKRFIKLIDIAERTQTMDEALNDAIHFYGSAMIDDLLRYQDQIEWLGKAVIGILFAMIAIGVYLPIFHIGALS